MQNEKYNYKSDIWSIGCVLYELATFQRPFVADNLFDLFKSIGPEWRNDTAYAEAAKCLTPSKAGSLSEVRVLCTHRRLFFLDSYCCLLLLIKL